MDTPQPNSSTESLYSSRKRERAQRYLAGVARDSYRSAPSIRSSLSSPENLVTPEDSTDELSEAISAKRAKREAVCTKGCQTALKRLAVAYSKVGVHTMHVTTCMYKPQKLISYNHRLPSSCSIFF